MAKPKLFPQCAVILEFKKSIGEQPMPREKILSQILVNFILWILDGNKELFQMGHDGTVTHTTDQQSFDDFLRLNIKRSARGFIEHQSKGKTSASFSTFLCNFKRVLDFFRYGGFANINLDDIANINFGANTVIVKRTRVGAVKKEPKHLPVHPLVEMYARESKFSNPKNAIFRLRMWICLLRGLDTEKYKAYFSQENVEKENEAVVCLVKNQPVQDHSTIAHEIVSISAQRLGEVLTCLCNAYPKNKKHLESEVRGFYAWLNSKKWAMATVPSKGRGESTHPLVLEYLSRFEKNTSYKQRKSRLKAMIAKILGIEQSKLIEHWTEDRIKAEERAFVLLKQSGLKAVRDYKESDLYKILSIEATQIAQIFDKLVRESPGLERTTKAHVFGFYRWLRGNGWTELDVDRECVEKRSDRGLEPKVLKIRPAIFNQPPARPESEVEARPPKAKTKLRKPKKVRIRKENQIEGFQSNSQRKVYSPDQIQALAREERRKRWAAEDQKKEAEKLDRQKKREAQALKRQALFALKAHSSSPLERALDFVKRNFDQKYFDRKIKPMLIQEEDSAEFRDFYELRNYLLYAFRYLYNIPEDYFPRFVNETQINVLGMSDKAILMNYLALKKQLNIQGEMLFVNVSGVSAFS